jgi:hypothetical protein
MSERHDLRPAGVPLWSGRRPSLFGRSLALAVSVAAACLLGEAGLRVTGYGRSYLNPFHAFHESDDLIGIRGRANFSGRLKNAEMDVVIANDARGFRKPAREVAAADSKRTIFVLGDSFIWGWGVGQGQVVTDIMQERLPDCRVRNFAVSGTGTLQQFALLKTFVLPELRSGDVVVLAFFGNDFGDNLGQNHEGCLYARFEDGKIRLVPPDGTACPHGLVSRVSDASYLVNLLTYTTNRLMHFWRNGHVASRPATNIATETRSPGAAAPSSAAARHESLPATSGNPVMPDDTAAVQVARFYLRAFEVECHQRGADFFVVYVPFRPEIGDIDQVSVIPPAPPPCAEREALFRCTAGLGIATLDLVTEFIAAKAKDHVGRLSYVNDFHWNPTGHRVAARAICEFLTGQAKNKTHARIAAVRADSSTASTSN